MTWRDLTAILVPFGVYFLIFEMGLISLVSSLFTIGEAWVAVMRQSVESCQECMAVWAVTEPLILTRGQWPSGRDGNAAWILENAQGSVAQGSTAEGTAF